MTESEFVYVTYIAAPQQKIWDAIVNPEFTHKYWTYDNISDWKRGALVMGSCDGSFDSRC